MQKQQSVEELMQLRTKIDDELSERLSQNLCLMLADVVGSTSFYQEHGDVQGRLFVQRHHDILSPLIHKHEGTVIKTIGDAIMASFKEPSRALDCAVAVQQTLWETNQEGMTDTPLRTKISLHYGSALVETDDIFGDLVNMSSRLNSLVEPDQILISEEVYEHVNTHTQIPLLPLESVQWKKGEKGLAVYEVLWKEKSEGQEEVLVFRNFGGDNSACFYCGLREHSVSACPSKQLTGNAGRLDRLGYLPLPEILRYFQQEELSTDTPVNSQNAHVFDAFYEISLPYQLRFLVRVWLTTSEDWNQIEKQQITASPMAGTRLWMGFDCLRVGRLDDAHRFFLAALDSNPGDYKPHVALGFWAMEKGNAVAALKHWREALVFVHNNLQAAYLHLLMYRFYDVNGKTDLAKQELEKALSKDPYLHEARYRQIALRVKAGKNDQALSQLQKLIQDDRTVFLKTVLDPDFDLPREQLVPLLSSLLSEARRAAIDRMRQVSGDLNVLREWYQQPEAELVTVQKAVDRMRQYIKDGSYFGYRDVVDDGVVLRERIRKLMAPRMTRLRKEFTTILGTVRPALNTLSAASRTPRNGPNASRVAKCQRELERLPNVLNLHSGDQFWRAWKDLLALKTAVEQLDPASRHRGVAAATANSRRRSLLMFGLGGGIIATTALFGVMGYLAYFSNLQLPDRQLLRFLIVSSLSGTILGSGIGWVVQWYRS